jgi:tRNA uridine 5-carboxymethylaminomethyl modification enzyme
MYQAKADELESARHYVRTKTLTPQAGEAYGLKIKRDGKHRSIHDLLAYRDNDLARLTAIWPELGEFSASVAEQIEIDAHYAGYMDRQDADVVAFRRDEALILPENLDFESIGGLSAEMCEKLRLTKPATLGAAGRIAGVTPAALTALLRFVKRGGHATARSAAGSSAQ